MRDALNDPEVLQAALLGLQQQRSEIEGKIAEVRRRLRGEARGSTAGTDALPVVRKRRQLSAAARKRMAEATRKRWADYRQAKGE